MTQYSPESTKEMPKQTREMLLRYQRQSFQALLRHAWHRSSFYRELYSGAGIREPELADVTVKDLPIIDKQLLMENFDRAATYPFLRRNELDRWIHENRNPAANYRDDFIVVHSSGSSGSTGIFVCGRTEWQLAASAMAGRLPPPANYTAGKTKAAFYLASHGNFAGASVAVRMPRSIYDTLILSVLDTHEQTVKQLNDFQPHQLHGYASSIHELSFLAMTRKLRISPQRIFVGGDKLTNNMERDIRSVWNVPVYDLYSASESNFIAMRQSGEDEMSIIEDLNIVEVLDDANRLVSENQEGRVVLTNLYNFTLPIIRYDLGDYVAAGKVTPSSLYATLKDIRGRANDALPITLGDGQRATIKPYVLETFYVPGLDKLRFVSLRPDFLQILYVSGENLDAVIRQEFQRTLDLEGAAKTTFEIQRVSRIASNSHTGKYDLVRIRDDAKDDSIGVNGELQPVYDNTCDEPLHHSFLQTIEHSTGEQFESVAQNDSDHKDPKKDSYTTKADRNEPDDISARPESSIDGKAQHLSRWEMGDGQAEIETNHLNGRLTSVSAEQQGIQAKCFHPTGTFAEFKREEIEQSISERFEKIVRMYPDRIAVKMRDPSLTYEELNRAANRVAQTIIGRRGVGEEPITLLLEQGIPAIIAILGVLKAGKFYVPLDPAYPRAWLSTILEEVRSSVILTDNINLDLAMALAQDAHRVLNLDALAPNLSELNPGLSISPDSFAYIFYTSGSTGRPKGVLQTHRNVLHQLMLYTNGLHLSPDDRVTLLHSHGFSASRLDIFGALLNGAALLPFSLAQEPVANLGPWLLKQELTLFHWVPTAYRHFVETLNGTEQFSKLRLIILGSEPVSPRDVESYKRYFPSGCVLVNRFGATETGNISWYFIDKQSQIHSGVVPVGFPIEDIEVLLMDETDAQVRNNEIGEITIKSRYLSPGYWSRPALTRRAFPPDVSTTNKTMYRTGDTGYMLPDGCMVHLGRKDFQVKVRGHRIELEEIEKELLEHTAVREAAVVAREGRAGDKHLVAYIVVEGESDLRSGAFRSYLEARLPSFMIPAAFVRLQALPLMPNGKVNRQALVELDSARPDLDVPLAGPRNSVEQTLAKIWSDVLGIDRIGIHDNFFDSGGHSLLASQVISRVRQTFVADLPLRALFEVPTVAGLANRLETLLSTTQDCQSAFITTEEEYEEIEL